MAKAQHLNINKVMLSLLGNRPSVLQETFYCACVDP